MADACTLATQCGIDSWADVFRVVNIVLALLIAGGLMFDRYAPWRNERSVLRLLTFAIAGQFLWSAYTAAEVVWFIPDTASDAVANTAGIRVYGFTFWFVMILIALVIRRQRAKALGMPVW